MKEILRGMVVSPGVASGPAVVVREPNDLKRFKEGDVLIAKCTDPSFTVIFWKAAAVVTEVGGTASHAAIIAREMGIPCIVGACRATEIIQDGLQLKVDAIQGVVYATD